jgi:hypothetical protein
VRRLSFPLLALFPLLAATEAGAQMPRRSTYGVHEPTSWVSMGAALLQPWTVLDGTTGREWRFGNATQYTASLEKQLSNGATLGLRGTHARVPLTMSSFGGPSFDADANVTQAFTTLHVSSGTGFHSVFELSAGATAYYNFRERTLGQQVTPTKADYDFTFALGYGAGYSFSKTFSVDLVQDLTQVLHQKTGLAAGDDSSARLNGTRLVARFGLGS